MRTFGLIACSAVLLLAMTACVGPTYDEVLLRQVLAYKDSLTMALGDVGAPAAAGFAEDLKQNATPAATQFWDGTSDPEDLRLAAGGIVIWDVQTRSNSVVLSAMIYSGPRDAKADPFANPDTVYWGPKSVYTCTVIEASVPTVEYEDTLSIGKQDCPAALVGTLDGGAVFAPISDFYG